MTDYEIITFSKPEEALAHLQENDADLVISDYFMPEMDGITFLSKVRDVRPETTRIILTGYPDVDMAVEAMKQGAFDYLQKPVRDQQLLDTITRAIEQDRDQTRAKLDYAEARLEAQEGQDR